jgi:hypothetical protein
MQRVQLRVVSTGLGPRREALGLLMGEPAGRYCSALQTHLLSVSGEYSGLVESNHLRDNGATMARLIVM